MNHLVSRQWLMLSRKCHHNRGKVGGKKRTSEGNTGVMSKLSYLIHESTSNYKITYS